ncbi:MAG: transglycosylase SLT domain-containing protein [Candidatus Acidiferrum sp.]
MAKENFPALPAMPHTLVKIPAAVLESLIGKTKFAISMEESRYTWPMIAVCRVARARLDPKTIIPSASEGSLLLPSSAEIPQLPILENVAGGTLTVTGFATYHRAMRTGDTRRVLRAAPGVLALLCLCGCDDASKRPVQARVPALAPAPQVQAPQIAAVQEFPLRKMTPDQFVSLMPPAPRGIPYLIEQVKAKFASGEANYKAGHLAAARRDFDDAVDWMLESGYDPNSDPALRQVFDEVTDKVYTYELQAFRAGDGFSEAPAVPAPIDEVAEMTFPVDPKLKERAEDVARNVSHDLPLTVNDVVVSYLNFFQTPHGKAIVENGLRRKGKYQEMISRVLREEGVPQDLIYLAQAESAFQPLALSRAGARGMWQFVQWRGNEYGLKRSWWVDERLDPEKATRAAAQHLRDLYGLYGDWYLAMAAYNCGPGNVQKGIERTGYADFWELYKRNVLPQETKNYVPIILALTLIAKDAAHYGISVDPEAPMPTDIVKPGRAIDLRLVAETIDVDVSALRVLNPSLLRMITPDDPDFELRLPVGTSQKFSAEIADIPADKWVSWRRHRVQAGETLTSIAKQYRVTASAIADANNLPRGAELETGEKLIIPALRPQDEGKPRLVRYRVRKGDTLGGIADQFSVTSEQVVQWNRLKSPKVSRGMILRIYTVAGGPETHAVHHAAARHTAKKRPAGTTVATKSQD